jgi:translation initiation factor IF-3
MVKVASMRRFLASGIRVTVAVAIRGRRKK